MVIQGNVVFISELLLELLGIETAKKWDNKYTR